MNHFIPSGHLTWFTDQKQDFEDIRAFCGSGYTAADATTGRLATVELLHCNGFQMAVDEDGRSKNHPFNQLASVLAGREIVGMAVVLIDHAMLKTAP